MKSTILAFALIACLLVPEAVASAPARSSEAAQRGSVVLSGGPGVPGADANTHTVYVPIQCRASFCPTPPDGHVVDVIDTARCNASVVSGCRVIARIPVGKSPLDAVVDTITDTIYVVNGSGSVSVVDGARCNAAVRSGCSRARVATVTTGGGATSGGTVAGALDPRTHTLYVASLNGYVFAVNVADCTGTRTSGCHRPVRRIRDRLGPDAVDVDLATDTVYAANAGPLGNGTGDTVSVIDGARCSGSIGSGCGARPRTVKVGNNPQWVAVDQATNSVYVASFNDGTVSVINGARCNATVGAGCAHVAPSVLTGANPGFVAIDEPLHTAFVMNSFDDTLAAIDTNRCDGAHRAGCGALPRSQQAGANQGPGFAQFPTQLALIAGTGTAYAVNVGGSSVLAVLDVSGCTATRTSTCRHPAPSVQDPEYEAALDPSTDTIYASNRNLPQIDVLNGATCHAGDRGGCRPVATIPVQDPADSVDAIDAANHTLYAADPQTGTLALIDTATCNAHDTAGCRTKPATITVGSGASATALNPATQSLYTVIGMNADHVAVINAATCNAQVMSGCGQPIGVVPVGVDTGQLAVDQATDTIYAPSIGQHFSGNTVDVINGASCNGTVHSGCSAVAATIPGSAPAGVAVDDATHTLYVANNAAGDYPGTVTIINTDTCNGTETSGCSGSHPAIPIGRAAQRVAIDATTNEIYVTNIASATVSIINGATCNATVTTGCSKPAAAQPVGSLPYGLAINPVTDTVYALNGLGSGSTSIFAGTP